MALPNRSRRQPEAPLSSQHRRPQGWAAKVLAEELHYTENVEGSTAMNVWLQKRVTINLAENGGKSLDLLRYRCGSITEPYLYNCKSSGCVHRDLEALLTQPENRHRVRVH